MQTSNSDIYAVGDAVEVKDFISGNEALIPLAGPANKQGRIAANNICGLKEKFEGTQGTSIVKVFDITVAVTGNNERTLKRNGIEYEKSFTTRVLMQATTREQYQCPSSCCSAKDGKLLGAQIVGYDV
jgi:NADPH-dependent 2,4-dienoyl-CoA reductase/sulfur reductase-like enzyme